MRCDVELPDAAPPVLTIDGAAAELIAHGLITSASIINGDLSITSVARRNYNLRVERSDGVSYLIKQPTDLTGRFSLSYEATFYSYCNTEPHAGAIKSFLPSLVYFDPNTVMLVLELYRDAKNLRDYHQYSDPSGFPTLGIKALGSALGALHSTFSTGELAHNESMSWLRRGVPWIMEVHRPTPEVLATLSAANYQTLRILQTQAPINSQLDALRTLWTPMTVIHGDIKSDNFLIEHPSDGSLPTTRLVDWETVQYGDPAWDIAGVLQDCVILWINSFPAGLLSVDALVDAERCSLAAIHPLLRAFWRSYRQTAESSARGFATILQRAVRYSAARLIQSAYEMCATANALPPASVLLLQLSSNILSSPETAQVQVYGLYQDEPEL